MPDSVLRWTCIGIYYADNPDVCQPLAVERKLVIFDDLYSAQSFLPRMGGGRLSHWSKDRETVFWTPIDRNGFNRATVITGYDPFDVPNGWREMGIWSEAKGLPWKYHSIWTEVWPLLLAYADSLEASRLQMMFEPVEFMVGDSRR